MKKLVIIFGFILCAVAGFALMNISSTLTPYAAAWANGGVHMTAIEQKVMSMMDKCRLDRLQGRLKNHEESVGCSNPTIREAFIAEGFTNTEKLDEYLKLRQDYAKMFDAGEITADQKRDRTEDALQDMLAFAPADNAKK